jgi:hypothetical protein
MNRKKYQFFHGLDGNGLEDTLDQYTDRAFWQVHTMGHNEDGFWILFVVEL